MAKTKWKYGKGDFPSVFGAIVILLLIVCQLNFGPMLSFGIYSLDIAKEEPYSLLFDFFIVIAPYLLTFIALLLSSNFLLRTKIRKLITGERDKLNLRFAFLVFAIYFLAEGIFSLIGIRDIELSPSTLKEKLMMFLPILILIPMQSIVEEVIYRVLPLRIIYKNNPPKTLLGSLPIILVSGVLFLIPHLANQEIRMNSDSILAMIYYVLWGALAMALSIYTGGFEAPIAMHAANNLFIAYIVNYPNGALPSAPIFINTNTLNSPILTLIETVVVFAIIFAFSYIVKRRKKSLLVRNEEKSEGTEA